MHIISHLFLSISYGSNGPLNGSKGRASTDQREGFSLVSSALKGSLQERKRFRITHQSEFLFTDLPPLSVTSVCLHENEICISEYQSDGSGSMMSHAFCRTLFHMRSRAIVSGKIILSRVSHVRFVSTCSNTVASGLGPEAASSNQLPHELNFKMQMTCISVRPPAREALMRTV